MKTILFDFDGTLLDSTERHTVLLRDILREELPGGDTVPSLERFMEYKRDGMSTRACLEKEYGFDPVFARRCAEKWRERIENREYLALDHLYPDSTDALENLSHQYRLVLISSRKSEAELNRQIDFFRIGSFFQAVHCVAPGDSVRTKAFYAARYPDAVLVVGDTEADLECAAASGLPFYALNRGFRSQSFWDEKNIRSFGDLSSIRDLC